MYPNFKINDSYFFVMKLTYFKLMSMQIEAFVYRKTYTRQKILGCKNKQPMTIVNTICYNSIIKSNFNVSTTLLYNVSFCIPEDFLSTKNIKLDSKFVYPLLQENPIFQYQVLIFYSLKIGFFISLLNQTSSFNHPLFLFFFCINIISASIFCDENLKRDRERYI